MKSSNDVQKRERTRLLELANEYRSKGYEVFIEPGIEARPQFLGDYRLDLVAISPQDKVVVEVKSRDSLERSAYLEEIAREIEKHPSWRFDLVLTNPRVRTDFSEEWTLLPLGELNARFLQAQRFADDTGQLDTAMLLLWVVVESALMHIAKQEGFNPKRRSALQLVKELFSLGLLSKNNYSVLEKAAQYRNKIVHGFTSRAITEQFYDSFSAVVDKTLENLQEYLNQE